MVFDAVVWLLLILIFILMVFPIFYILVISFGGVSNHGWSRVRFIPRMFMNFYRLLSQNTWINAIKISILRTIIGTLLTVMLTSIFAYALSNERLMFGKTYRFMVVFAMYFSGGLIPMYILLKYMHLLDTFAVYVIPTMLNLFFVIVGINFFSMIPSSLAESGRLDGASEWKIFCEIILPVSIPFIATLAMFSAVNQWNSWVDSSYYVQRKNLRPMAYLMISEINRTGSLNTQATAMVLSMIPMLCINQFAQKYYVQGIILGAVKE